MVGLILIDQTILNWYSDDIYFMILLMGLVPLAANIVAFAAHLKLPAEEAALAVLLSTLAALFYLPIMITLLSALLNLNIYLDI